MKDIVREKKKKFIIKLFLIVLIPLMLCTIFGLVDYFRATNGEKPIFIYHTIDTTIFDVEVAYTENALLPSSSKEETTNAGIGQNAIVFEDIVLPNKEGAIYQGIGYSVSTCDNGSGNYIFQLGQKKKEPCSSSLICTKTFAENNKQTFSYYFFDGKVYRIDTTLTIPAKQITDEETYKKGLIEINDIKGCGVILYKQNDTTYITTQMCNISNMSDHDVEKVYSASKKSLEQTKVEIIDKYSNDKDMICE